MRIALVLGSSFLIAAVFAQQNSGTDSISIGREVYSQTCVACHGVNGKGVIPGVRDLSDTDGMLAKPDDILLRNITEGLSSPNSVIAMPPKGGNPTLGDAEIRAVLAFLRSEFGGE